MDYDTRLAEIIAHAEKSVAELAAEATAKRDYARASQLLAVADRLSRTVEAAALPAGRQAAARPARESDVAAPAAPPRPHPLRTPTRNRNYPRFKRTDDTLVKIGWSKSDKATYEHRSPRSTLQRLIERIVEVSRGDELFTTDQILPLMDDDGAELPTYQVYLSLAWLVTESLIVRHGRRGYTLSDPETFRQSADAAWEALPRR